MKEGQPQIICEDVKNNEASEIETSVHKTEKQQQEDMSSSIQQTKDIQHEDNQLKERKTTQQFVLNMTTTPPKTSNVKLDIVFILKLQLLLNPDNTKLAYFVAILEKEIQQPLQH